MSLSRRDALKHGIRAAGLLAIAPEIAAAESAATAHAFPASAAPAARPSAAPAGRERLRLDPGWRFHLGHADDPAQDFGFGQESIFAKTGDFVNVAKEKFDDSGWTAVDLPHDWAVELPFVNAPELISSGCKPLGRRFPATSIGWYRKVFDLPAGDAGRRITVDFDGAFRDCIVAFNGSFIGRSLSGYAPFSYDVTDYANFGGRNVLVVRADATEHEGWFYEGAGIYRHVWLTKTHPVHVAQWGTYVNSRVGNGSAELSLATEVVNDGDAPATCRVVSTVLDAGGRTVATARSAPVQVASGATVEVRQTATVARPALWSIETPHMYTLVTHVDADGVSGADRYETPFGIRTVHFDPDHGFFLNGKHVEVKGTCNHQDHAGVGAALPDRLQYFRVERLKEMASNAYRTSHNPPTPELLDACDRLGMLVLDETRMFSSEPEGLSQLERLVRRDRNHPSVFAWSIANEEWVLQGKEQGARIAATMKRLVRQLDPSRPITEAMNGDWGKGLSAVVDVQGFNYNLAKMDAFRAQFPRKPTMGTEVGSTVSTRGIYANDKAEGYVSAYDVNAPPWASTAEAWWSMYDARPWIAGGFVWTGFDYRGEPTPYGWPCISSHFGILDTCGFPKDNFYYYKARWGDEPVLHLFPHWNWTGREGQEIDVWVHTNLERVELFLNGQSLGAQTLPKDGHLAWKVKYAPGTIEARGFRGGTQVLSSMRATTGAPARLVLHPDRTEIGADGEDVSVVAVRVVDAQGRDVPVASDEVTFNVTGAGKLIGVGNGDPSSHESDKAATRHLFNGLAVAIVQAGRQGGDLRVDASAPGLQGASATIRCRESTPRAAI